MKGAGTWAGPQPSLRTVPASRDLFVLTRETHLIGFCGTAERQKRSCQAGGASRRFPAPPRPGAPEPRAHLPPAPQPPQPGPSPGSAGPEPSAAPVPTYGRAEPGREQQHVRPRSPQLSRRGTGGGDTRIEGAGPRRPDRPGDALPAGGGIPSAGNPGLHLPRARLGTRPSRANLPVPVSGGRSIAPV